MTNPQFTRRGMIGGVAATIGLAAGSGKSPMQRVQEWRAQYQMSTS